MGELLKFPKLQGEVPNPHGAWGGPPGDRKALRTCGHAGAGEGGARCFRCSRHYCPTCAAGGGSACPACGGPVWKPSEAPSAERPNPVMKGY